MCSFWFSGDFFGRAVNNSTKTFRHLW
jgi:hypothetical protein